jgi:hypothetical protein
MGQVEWMQKTVQDATPLADSDGSSFWSPAMSLEKYSFSPDTGVLDRRTVHCLSRSLQVLRLQLF